jgi:hypothetical protein
MIVRVACVCRSESILSHHMERTDQLRELLELAQERPRDGVGQHDVKDVEEEELE